MTRPHPSALLPISALALASLLAGACGSSTSPAADTRVPADTSPPADATAPLDASPPEDTPAPTDTADTDAAADTSLVVTEPCGTGSAAALAGCVEASRLSTDLAQIEGARPTGTAHHALVRDLLAERLAELGFTVELDDYGRGVNVIGTRLGQTSPDELVLISAHYDGVPNCAGADDNGSGVVGALEAARVLASLPHDRTLVIAFWDEEEKGLLGAFDWADRLARAQGRVVVSFVLEMIGYTSDAPNSQTLPEGFEVLFPDVVAAIGANQNRGDFIGLIADQASSPHTTHMAAFGAALGHPTVPLLVPAALLGTGLINDLRRSDHAAFWAHGWPAMMITDTANFRNPNYHCAAGPDAASDLDFDFAANTVAVTVYAAALALDLESLTPAVPAASPACDLLGQTGCATGKKCTIHAGGAGLFQPACLNIPASPAARGEACTRPAGIPGEDTCGAGLFCTFWGRPRADPQTFWCRDLCVSDEDCPTGERCQALLGAAPGHGACIPACDPFDAEACPSGAHCIGERAGTDRTAAFGCTRVGTTGPDASCSTRSDNCQAGLMCVPSALDGVERCRALCDAGHACSGELTCVPLPNPPPDRADKGLGTCQ